MGRTRFWLAAVGLAAGLGAGVGCAHRHETRLEPESFSEIEGRVRMHSDTTQAGRLEPGGSTPWVIVPYDFSLDRRRLAVPEDVPVFDEQGPVAASRLRPGQAVVVFLREHEPPGASVVGVRILDPIEAREIQADLRRAFRARR